MKCTSCTKDLCDGCNIRNVKSGRIITGSGKWREIEEAGVAIFREYEKEGNLIGFCPLSIGKFARHNSLTMECNLIDFFHRGQKILFISFEEENSLGRTLEVCQEERRGLHCSWSLPARRFRSP